MYPEILTCHSCKKEYATYVDDIGMEITSDNCGCDRRQFKHIAEAAEVAKLLKKYQDIRYFDMIRKMSNITGLKINSSINLDKWR